MPNFDVGNRVRVSDEATTVPAHALGKVGTVIYSSPLEFGQSVQRPNGAVDERQWVANVFQIELDGEDEPIFAEETDLSPE